MKKRKIIITSLMLIAVLITVSALTLSGSVVAYAASLPSDNSGQPAYAGTDADQMPINAENALGGEGDTPTDEVTDAPADGGAHNTNNEGNAVPDNNDTKAEDNVGGAGGEEVEAEADGGENGATDSDNGEKESEGSEAIEENGSAQANPFESAFEVLRSISAEILCTLTFIGSLILAWAYKKGLLPLLRGGLGAISTAVSKIKQTAESGENATRELTKTVIERLDGAENALEKMTEGLDGLCVKLGELKSDEEDRARLKTLMAAQVEMLYDIFMTSSLPQYQKDAVGERIAAMKEALGKNEE